MRLAIKMKFLSTEVSFLSHYIERVQLLLARGFLPVLLWKPIASVIIRGSSLLTYPGGPRGGGGGSIPVFQWGPRVLVIFQVGYGNTIPSSAND